MIPVNYIRIDTAFRRCLGYLNISVVVYTEEAWLILITVAAGCVYVTSAASARRSRWRWKTGEETLSFYLVTDLPRLHFRRPKRDYFASVFVFLMSGESMLQRRVENKRRTRESLQHGMCLRSSIAQKSTLEKITPAVYIVRLLPGL